MIDLLAAVGMWLATPWGGVLWLLVTLSQIAVAIAVPSFFDGGYHRRRARCPADRDLSLPDLRGRPRVLPPLATPAGDPHVAEFLARLGAFRSLRNATGFSS